MPLRRRILTVYALLGGLLVAAAVFQFFAFSRMQKELDDVSRARFEVEKRIRESREMVWRIDSSVLSALFFDDLTPEEELSRLDQQASRFYVSMEAVRKSLGLRSQEVRGLFNAFQAYYLFGKRMLGRTGDAQVREEMVTVFHDLRTELVREMDRTYAHTAGEFDRHVLEADQLARRLSWFSWVALAAGLLAAGVISMLTLRSILRPLRDVGGALERISSGDFSVRLSERYHDEQGELARGLNRMSEALAQRESALRDSERRFRSLFENATNGFFRCRVEGTPVLINPGMAHMLGYENPSELLERATGASHDFASMDDFLELQQMLVRDGRVQGYRTRLVRRDGEIINVLADYALVHDEVDGEDYVEGVVTDITAQVRAKSLERARQDAEAASRAKSRFLANMSHEIRSPMNVILAMAELLGEGELSARQRHYLQVLQRSGLGLLEIINSVLDLSKIEAGRIELELVPFDMNELLVRVRDMAASKAREGNLWLMIRQTGPQPETVVGDSLRLRQVLLNLLDNAFRFTCQGGVTLSLHWSIEQARANLTVTVSDTGPGIAADRYEAVFESFTQEDSSTTRRFGGTGLGLTIARQLVEHMGGSMNLESELGEGTSFRFSVALELAGPYPATSPLKGLRVLCYDPDRRAEEGLPAMLREFGAHAAWAPKSVSMGDMAAQARMRGELFDAAVVRGEDWKDAARAMGESSHPSVPVVALLPPDALPGKEQQVDAHVDALLPDPPLQHEMVRLMQAASEGRPLSVPRETEEPVALPSPQTDDGELNVLLVEDSEFNRTVVSSFLEHVPMKLHVARNGREAINLFRQKEFDLIIMDMLMPIMDGYQATREIRSIEELRGSSPVPILALTANAFKEDRDRCMKAGCTDYLSKPVRKGELVDAVIRLTHASDVRAS